MARTIPVCILLLLPSFALADDFEDGVEALGKKEYDSAITSFTAAIKENPRSARAFTGRGVAYGVKKDYDKAIKDFSEAIRLEPKDATAYFYRGNTFSAKKEYDKAIKDYSEAIRLEPKDASAYFNRGNVYGKKKEYGKAIKDYSEVIRLEPEDPHAFHNRGITYYDKKEYAKAIKDYSEAIRLDPEYGRVYDSLAWLLATCPKDDVRDGKKAVEYATKACELTEWKDGFCLDNLAAAHAESGNFKEAVKRQKAAIELGFTNKEIMEGARKRLKLYQDGKPYRSE